MKLYELLSITSENTILTIRDYDTYNLLAEYDGKSSIPEKYNDFEVKMIEHDAVCINRHNRPRYSICYYIKSYKLDNFNEESEVL